MKRTVLRRSAWIRLSWADRSSRLHEAGQYGVASSGVLAGLFIGSMVRVDATQPTSARIRTPTARATFRTVAKLGFPFSPRAL